MAAPKKQTVLDWEAEQGLSSEGLSYQHRHSRWNHVVVKGEPLETWQAPAKKAAKAPQAPYIGQAVAERQDKDMFEAAKKSHVIGKKLWITPIMEPDKNRFKTYDEPLGEYIEVEEADAGAILYEKPKGVDREVADYQVTAYDPNKQIIGKASVPKINTEITYTPGKDLVPVVRGHKGDTGYLWIFPAGLFPVLSEDGTTLTYVQIRGLKSLIEASCPELLPRFSGEHIAKYIDGVTSAVDITQTIGILKEFKRQELRDVAAGLA